MNRRLIGIIAPVLDGDYLGRMVEGAVYQAKKLDMNVAIFSPLEYVQAISHSAIGELNIYNLLKYDCLDGVIYIKKGFYRVTHQKLIENILDHIKTIPIISIETSDSKYETIDVEHVSNFYDLTNHMIEVHGYKKIYCLTGQKEVEGSRLKLEGYCKAMDEHNLTYTEDFIIYGDYWITSGRKLAEDIIAGKIEKPEAIVCGNDEMAMALTNILLENGIQVPGEIAVAGYNSKFMAMNNLPSITSYDADNFAVGAKAIIRLYEKITGKKATYTKSSKCRVVQGESCGCLRDYKLLRSSSGPFMQAKEESSQLYKMSNMLETLSNISTLRDYIHRLNELTYINQGMEMVAVCLGEDWNTMANDSTYRNEGYPESMRCMFYKEKEDVIVMNQTFPTRQLLPYVWEHDVPRAYFFTPLHFLDRCFGYIVHSYGEENRGYNEIFSIWCRDIATTLEFIRVKIYVNERNTKRLNLVAKAVSKGTQNADSQVFVNGYTESEVVRINVKDIYYISSNDDDVFINEGKKIYKAKKRLYEFEYLCIEKQFLRISKSIILNVSKIRALSLAVSGGYQVILMNGEKLLVARRKVAEIRKTLSEDQ